MIFPHLRDDEYIQENGRWLIPRLLPDPRSGASWDVIQGNSVSTSPLKLEEAGSLQLSSRSHGNSAELGFEMCSDDTHELTNGLLEIDVKAFGLNMDVRDHYCMTGCRQGRYFADSQ